MRSDRWDRLRWARLAQAHRQLGGQIFNPATPSGFALNGADVLVSEGASTSSTVGALLSLPVARTSGTRFPAWCTITNGGVGAGQINFLVPNAWFWFIVDVDLVTAPPSLTGIKLTATVGGGGDNSYNAETGNKVIQIPGQTSTKWMYSFTWLWQTNSTNTNTVCFLYQVQGSVGADNYQSSPLLRGFRVA
jgi:hypothetical protein